MVEASFYAQSRVLIVAGKGGVGKTTLAATLARAAGKAGCSVLVVELEGKTGISAAFGKAGPLDYEPLPLTQTYDISGRRLTPDDALVEYLCDHGFARLSRRLASTGVIDVVATAIPGIKDVLVLGKIKQLERECAADLIVVDAPATGHAMTFLTSAAGLVDSARAGPLRTQAAEVVEFLGDPKRCRVLLVTLAEEMPVAETIEAAYGLEDKANVQLGPVIVNAIDPLMGQLNSLAVSTVDAAEILGVGLGSDQINALEEARKYRLFRATLQSGYLEKLKRELPLHTITLDEIPASQIGQKELDHLAANFHEQISQIR